jgi:hypothetical protein
MWKLVAAVAVLMIAMPAVARPPTVGINPGYDRRLAESRNQQAVVPAQTVRPVKERWHRH